MLEKDYFIKASELKYSLNESDISNSILVESSIEDIPSVSYLNLSYEGELKIPVEIFTFDLTPLQAIVKYAKEQKSLTNSELSSMIGRSVRTIWLTYSCIKKRTLPKITTSKLLLPISLFKDDKLSALEALVSFLKKTDLTYAQIARLLSKDQRTIWTVYSRASKKNKEEKNDS